MWSSYGNAQPLISDTPLPVRASHLTWTVSSLLVCWAGATYYFFNRQVPGGRESGCRGMQCFIESAKYDSVLLSMYIGGPAGRTATTAVRHRPNTPSGEIKWQLQQREAMQCARGQESCLERSVNLSNSIPCVTPRPVCGTICLHSTLPTLRDPPSQPFLLHTKDLLCILWIVQVVNRLQILHETHAPSYCKYITWHLWKPLVWHTGQDCFTGTQPGCIPVPALRPMRQPPVSTLGTSWRVSSP